jgi:hypothetical protein
MGELWAVASEPVVRDGKVTFPACYWAAFASKQRAISERAAMRRDMRRRLRGVRDDYLVIRKVNVALVGGDG